MGEIKFSAVNLWLYRKIFLLVRRPFLIEIYKALKMTVDFKLGCHFSSKSNDDRQRFS
jgi:hypothetical protein